MSPFFISILSKTVRFFELKGIKIISNNNILMIRTTHMLVLIFSCLLKDSALQCFLLSSTTEFLVLHWIIPINKHALMHLKNKQKPYIFLQIFSLLSLTAKLLKRDVQICYFQLFFYIVLNPLQSNFLLSISLKLLLLCSTLITMMLSLKANSQASCYMTYFHDHVSQFTQNSHGFGQFSPYGY